MNDLEVGGQWLEMGQDVPVSVLWESGELLIANKPSGLLFHGYTKGLPRPLAESVRLYFQQSRAQEQAYVGVVQRLDRPVSGLSLFAKSPKIASLLQSWAQQGVLRKYYLALVTGEPTTPFGLWEDTLEALPSTDNPRARIGPQLCRLVAQCVAQDQQYKVIAIELLTGRRHQIRRQLHRRGIPIVNDLEYGASSHFLSQGPKDPRFAAIGLHCFAVKFPVDPQFHLPPLIRAPLPWYWPAFAKELRPELIKVFDES